MSNRGRSSATVRAFAEWEWADWLDGRICWAERGSLWAAAADPADGLGPLVLPGGGTVDVTLANNKHKVFALGPDVTLPIASKSKLYALVNMRYLWEMGARTKTQGVGLVVTATLPVPSVKLK